MPEWAVPEASVSQPPEAAEPAPTPEVTEAQSPHWRTAAILLTALLVLVGSGWGLSWVASSRVPSQSGPEVGFARDMFAHHEQAVAMSFLIRGRTDDPVVNQLAMDVAQGQATQQGRMLAWLDASGVGASTGDYTPMAWMLEPDVTGGHGAEHTAPATPPEGVHPMVASMGMATDEQLSELGRLSGRDAEVLYLQLMYRHHEGGLEMAQAFLDRSDEPTLSRLAEVIVTTQQREMTIIEDLLSERGAEVPDE
jgi:uncharacterized protein (DUF305 family)